MRKLRFCSLFLVSLSFVAIARSVPAQDPTLSDVLASSPDLANAILYMDVPAIRKLTAGSLLQADLPESMGEVRIASDLNLKTIEPSWEIGYVTMLDLPDLPSLAKSNNGYVDIIAGTEVMWSPKQMYLFPTPNNVLGLVRPADRKLLTRWLRKESKLQQPDFLKQQATQGTKFVSLLLAVDLQDMLSPIAIQERVTTFESLKGKDIAPIVKTLSTLKGIRVLIGRRNLDECIISLEFDSPPASLLQVAKNFFVEVLDRNQSSIPEASKWIASVSSNTLSFRGTISANTIDDLLGIFTLQTQVSNVEESRVSANKLPVDSESARLNASMAYFSKTTNFIKRVRDYTPDSIADRATWNGKMARRIDELPTLNVDPDLIEFGTNLAKGLRGNMVTIQQTSIAAGASRNLNANYSGSSSGYNYFGAFNDGNQPYRYDAAARSQGTAAYKQMIADVEQMEGDIRRKMTQKFGVQF